MAYPIWFNGSWKKAEEVQVSVTDIGFLRGYGIFDFFRIMDGKPVFLSDHLDRFLRSADLMGLSLAYSKAELAASIHELAAMSTDACLGVKMVLTGGESINGFDPAPQSNLWILPGVFQFADPERGMRLMSQVYVREMAEIKSLNYAFAIRNWAQVKASGADDLIYFTAEHGVSESSRSNLFYVKAGVIHTPDVHILEGITRKNIIQLAAEHYAVKVGKCSLTDFLEADEVFTTGSTKRVVPILAIDGQPIGDGSRGPVAKHLYDLLVEAEGSL
jgi:D-alanine transaminase/branched-chain amino acid aminotransferase